MRETVMKRRIFIFAAVMAFVCFMLSCNNKERKMEDSKTQNHISFF